MPFIEREYQVDGMDTPLVLQIEDPYWEDGNWIFEYRLLGLSEHFGYTAKAAGVDKLQALAGALFKISVDLEFLQRDVGLRITWEDPRLGLVFI